MYKLYIKKTKDSQKLLQEALSDYANIKNYKLEYNQYQKPFLKNKNIYFNISHTKNLCVCVIADCLVGVDIECIKYHKLSNRWLTSKELKTIAKAKNKAKAFTNIWVKKESYIKMLGIGLSYGLNKIETTKLKKQIIMKKYKNNLIAICLDR